MKGMDDVGNERIGMIRYNHNEIKKNGGGVWYGISSNNGLTLLLLSVNKIISNHPQLTPSDFHDHAP